MDADIQEPRNLDYGLLIPRSPIKFKKVDGRLELVDLSKKVEIPPVVITTNEAYDYIGFPSGRRSGLLKFDAEVYKFKGCGIEAAFGLDDYYRVPFGDESAGLYLRRARDARGGQLLTDARNEIQSTIYFNEILAQEGFPTPHIPIGIVHYGIEFAPYSSRLFQNFSEFFKFFKENSYGPVDFIERLYKKSDEMINNAGRIELASSVMKIKGDTRLDEIYSSIAMDEGTGSTAAYRFGLIAGAQKRVTEDKFFWSLENSHIGNYVVFSEGNELHLSMVDFETARQSRFYDRMFKKRLNRWEKELTVRSLHSLNERRRERGHANDTFTNAFTRGFNEGYSNPDLRKPITLDMLCEEIDLQQNHMEAFKK